MNNQTREYFAKDFFIYELDFASIAAGASATLSFNVQADSDFLLTKLAYHNTIADANYNADAAPIPNVGVIIQDTGSGRQLMNSAVPVTAIFGTGQLPFILPRQRLFLANSTINVTLTNFSAATASKLRLSFIGEKAFVR
jgi:hypothetical protein